MEYNWQSAIKLNVVKDVIMLVTYFLNGPMFNLLFNHKLKLYRKFQRFNAIAESIEMLKMVEFPKNSFKMKNCKIFYDA